KTDEKPKSGNGAQKKIDRLVKLNAQRERELDDLRKEMETLKSRGKVEEKPQQKTGEPQKEDFTDYEEYLIAKATYRLEQKQRMEREIAEQKSEDAKLKTNYDSFQERAAEARAKYDDFDDVINVKTPWAVGAGETPSKEAIAASNAFY